MIDSTGQLVPLNDGVLKSCLKANLPEHAGTSTLIIATDTGEVFQGRGSTEPLHPITGISADELESIRHAANALNTGAISSQINNIRALVVDKANIDDVYTKRQADSRFALIGDLASIQASADTASTNASQAIAKAAITESLVSTATEKANTALSTANIANSAANSALEAANTASENAESALNTANNANSNAATAHAIATEAKVSADNALSAVESKLDKSVFESYVRDAASSGDVAAALALKVDKEVYQAHLSDFASIQSRIGTAETNITNLQINKADKSDLDNCRKISDNITSADLDENLRNLIIQAATPVLFDDSALREEDARLDNVKADKSELQNYRAKSDKILTTDLDPTVVNYIAQNGYDDTAITSRVSTNESNISSLQANKADKSELQNYRNINDKITSNDLDQTVINYISENGYDDTELAGRVTTVENNIDNLETETARLENVKLDKTAFNSYKETVQTNFDAYEARITELERKVGELTRKIEFFDPISDLYPAYGTNVNEIGLPETASAHMDDGSVAQIHINWDTSNYDKFGENTTQTISGTIIRPLGVENPLALGVSVNVIVGRNPDEGSQYEWSYNIALNKSMDTIDSLSTLIGQPVTFEDIYGEGIDEVESDDFSTPLRKRKVELRLLGYIGRDENIGFNDNIQQAIKFDNDYDFTAGSNRYFDVKNSYHDGDGLRVPLEIEGDSAIEEFANKVDAVNAVSNMNNGCISYTPSDESDPNCTDGMINFSGGQPAYIVYMIRKIKSGYLEYPETEN